MTSARLVFGLLVLASCSRHEPPPQAETHNRYGRLPLSFEVNNGQSDAQVQFLSRGSGYSLFLTSNEAVVALNQGSAEPADQTVLRMKLVDANPKPNIAGLDELPGKANYFTGNDPAKWRTNVATYSRVKYKDVYPGVDLVYYGNHQQLEYDFLIAPGADPRTIRMSFEGVDQVELDEHGDLVLVKEHGTVRQHRPRIYQEIRGEQKQVSGRYVLLGSARVGFDVGAYDPHSALVIDPVLSYSTYLGGSGDDRIPLIAVDATGQVYVAGQTSSTNFPTSNPLRPSYGGGPLDLFVAKLNAAGTALVYSTYLGGAGPDEIGSIALDQAGNAYVNGRTGSMNFPRVGAFQQTFGGGPFDAFVAKLDATGSTLLYSSYLGGTGTDTSIDCRVDAEGNFYVTGSTGVPPGASNNFPTVNALQPTSAGGGDAFVTKVNATGSALVYSTYLGGGGIDAGVGMAVDAMGNAYVHGQTSSMNFPTVNPVQPAYAGGAFDVFVTKLDSTGASLLYSTYLGGSGRDLARTIAVDATGSAYVTGFAGSADFPTVKPVQAYGGGEYDAFVAKLNPAGSALVYSTFLGGDGRDAGEGLAVDVMGNAYVAGFTTSTNFPTVNAIQEKSGGPPGGCVIGCDGFIAKLNSDGSALIYSTYFGGSGEEEIVYVGLDAAGNLYVTGQTTAIDFPTVNPMQPSSAGGNDVFLAKFSELTRPYSIVRGGGLSFLISGNPALTVGYARIQPNSGSRTPLGVAIFGLRQNNVLVNEAGVPASPRITIGRMYADVGGAVNTGIALANSNNQDVAVNFFFTNEAGQTSLQGSTTIPANRQIARFLNEAPFSAGSAFRGTLTFSASAPIGAIALRGFTNERAEFLLTTLPVVDLSSAAVSDAAVVPHFADGGGWTTTIVLVNSTDATETGSIQFFSQGSTTTPAQPLSVTINNQQSNTFAYTVPPRTSVRFQTAGSAAAVRAGSVRVTPAAQNQTPSTTAIFSLRNAGVVVTEAAASAQAAGSAFRTYVEAAGNMGQAAIGSIATGIAIATDSSVPVPVNFELMSPTGTPIGLTGAITVPAQGQVALFLSQIPGFQSLQLPFQGVLRISVSGSSKISLTGLRGRYNERGDFLITTTPPVNEASVPSNAEMMFPHWVIGGGYSTQFILINEVSAQTSSGMLRFFSQVGQPVI